MTGDLLNYLSGRVLFGVALIPLLGIAFTIIWIVVWRGTRFWDLDRFWKRLWQGWTIVFALYIAVWSWHRPLSIPVRVVVYTEAVPGDASGGWIADACADAIVSGLTASPRHFSLLRSEFVPALARVKRDGLESLAKRLKVCWLVVVSAADSKPRIEILRLGLGGYKRRWEGSPSGSTIAEKAAGAAIQVAQQLGDPNSRPASFLIPASLPDSDYSDFYRAIQLRREELPDSAAAVFTRLIDAHSGWIRPRLELALTWFDFDPGKRGADIHEHLMAAIAADSTSLDSYILLGHYFLYMRNWDMTESAFKLALSIAPNDPRPYYYLALLGEHRLQGMIMKSKQELLERAIDIAPGYESARLELGRVRQQLRERNVVNQLLEDGLEIDPGSVELLISLSANELAQAEFDSAAVSCGQILALDPGNYRAFYNLGIARMWLQQFDGALAAFDSALAHGGSEDCYFYKGVTCVRMKDYPKAIKMFQERMARSKTKDDPFGMKARDLINKIQGWMESDSSGAILLTE
jgi:tetratricopeptide (TPR) repeat protein